MILHTENLSVGYGRKIIVSGIEISISKGEIVTLIGANGSGKSTILKSISGQLSLISGTVFINKKSIEKMSETDISKKFSMVLTDKIHPELMTCEEVVATGRYPYTGRLGILSAEDKKAVSETMKLINITDIADKDFLHISDGQRQRVMLARAICQEPEILVLDEPTSFLDIKHKLELLYILKKLVSEKNIGVIMTLHELDLAQKISDRIICIKNGIVDKVGIPEDIFSEDYIRSLFDMTKGSFNENFGSMELEKTAGEPEIFVIGGGGSGLAVYRKLQRKGIPFAAGIIHENDVEYQTAKALAAEVISEKAFEPISDKTFEYAMKIMQKCKRVICCTDTFGTMNMANKRLADSAENLQIN